MISCQKSWFYVQEILGLEKYLPNPYPLWSCNCDSVPWVAVAAIQSAIWWHQQAGDVYTLPKCIWSCRHLLPLHITWSLHPSSVDALVDFHRRSWNFPLIHPRKVWLVWHWVVARPLYTCGIISLSLPMGVGLARVGLVYQSHPCRHLHKREHQSLM